MSIIQQIKDIEAALKIGSSVKEIVKNDNSKKSTYSVPTSFNTPEAIAIIGLSGSFPQSDTVDNFWQHLDQDACLIEQIPLSRFDYNLFYDATGKTPGSIQSKWGGFIPNIANFDAAFFNITPSQADTMDPRQRLLLMSAYDTLTDAGYSLKSLKKSKTGVFIAIQDNEYLKLLRDIGINTNEWYAQNCLLANRISYFFDFLGTSEIIDAQCPGAAVAIHRAVIALRTGEIKQALVGAANLLLHHEPFVLLSESGQLSPTNCIESFGLNAKGHLRAEGVATILLKSLSQAKIDGDHIYALIRNSAVNYNGQGGASISAPNKASHIDLIKTCYEQVNLDPRNINYIEAQGMGNPLADLVEWEAFNSALKELALKQKVNLLPGTCRISTIKPMLGHMESASTMGALFKIIRSIDTNVIHKIIGFSEYHPDLDRENQPCVIATKTELWSLNNNNSKVRVAGIHAYSMSGTNAHLLIEEYKPSKFKVTNNLINQTSSVLIILSAKTLNLLVIVAKQLRKFLEENHPIPRMSDLAFTLQIGRDVFAYRISWVVCSHNELINAINNYLKHADNIINKIDQSCIPVYQGLVQGDKENSYVTTKIPPLITNNLHALASYWVNGGVINWTALYHPDDYPCRIRLPGYPFEKQYHWVNLTADKKTESTQFLNSLPSVINNSK